MTNYWYINNININKNYWNWNSVNIKNWSLDKHTDIITIIGNSEKEPLANYLYNYLIKANKKVCLYSKEAIKTYSGKFPTDYKPQTIEDLATFLFICDADKPRYIIIECDEEELEAGIFDHLHPNFKIIAEHNNISEKQKEFIRNNPCTTLLNIDAKYDDEFINSLNLDLIQFYSTGTNYIYPEECFIDELKKFRKLTNKYPITFPAFKLGELGKSFFKIYLGECYHTYTTTLSFTEGVNVCISLAATLKFINEFDEFKYLEIITSSSSANTLNANKTTKKRSAAKKTNIDEEYEKALKYCLENYKSYTPVGRNK